MTKGLPLAVLCAALLGACSASHRRPLDPAELPEILARAECEVRAACAGGTLSIPGDPLPWIDVEACVRHSPSAESWRRTLVPWLEAVERGDALLDADAVAGCVEAMREAVCLIDVQTTTYTAEFPVTSFGVGRPGLPGFDPRCDAMFVGRGGVPVGEICEGPLDCVDGAHCVGFGPCEPNRCQAYPRAGDACPESLGACLGGQLACIDGRCVRRVLQRSAPAGAECGLLDDGAGGVIDERCAPGSQCTRDRTLDDERTLECVPVTLPEGAACNPFSDEALCVPPLRCSGGLEGTCRRLAYVAEGEPCDGLMSSDIAGYCDPEAGLACVRESYEVPGTCRPSSAGGEGDRCGPGEPCVLGLLCVDAICTAREPTICP